jgi:hypothetical protein
VIHMNREYKDAIKIAPLLSAMENIMDFLLVHYFLAQGTDSAVNICGHKSNCRDVEYCQYIHITLLVPI